MVKSLKKKVQFNGQKNLTTSKEKEKTKMALSRKFLAAMGIEADKIDEIIAAHSETVTALKTERDQYKVDAEKLPSVQEELKKVKAEKAEFEPYKAKYDKEHTDFEAYKADQTAKETKAKKTEAYKTLLKQAGISDKHLASLLKVSDVSGIEFDDEGKVKDADKKVEAIKSEWSDFIPEKQVKGAETKNPPENTGGKETSPAAKIAAKYYSNLYGTKEGESK